MTRKKKSSNKHKKVSARASARASAHSGGRPVVVVQGPGGGGSSSSSGGGGSGGGFAPGFVQMPFSAPIQPGIQLGTAPVQDWAQQHEMYRNALADSIKDNAAVHQQIADRFTSQIAELRDSQSELRGQLKASHEFALNSNAQLGHQLGASGLGNAFGAISDLRDRPTTHNNYYHHQQLATTTDARSINMMNNRDAGDVLEEAENRRTMDHLQQELAANAQGSTATAAAPLASQEAAIMTGNGNRIGTAPTLTLPTSTTSSSAEAGDGTVRIRPSFGERVSGSGAAPRGNPEIENAFGENVSPMVIAEPQPIVQRPASDLSTLQQAQAGVKKRERSITPADGGALPTSLLQTVLRGTYLPDSMVREINEQSHVASAQNALVVSSRKQNADFGREDEPPADGFAERPVSVPLEDNRKRIGISDAARPLSPLRAPVEERDVVPRKKRENAKPDKSLRKSKTNT
jgi:hypothetical protein